MSVRDLLIAATIALGVLLWLSATADRVSGRRVLGIGPRQRLAIALIGAAAILAIAWLAGVPLGSG